MAKHVAIVASLATSLINFRRPLIERLLAAGHRITAIAPHCERTERALHGMGIVFIGISLSRTALNPVADALLVIRLARILRRISPDCVLSYTAKPVIYGTIAARIAGVPQIAAMITGLGYSFTSGSGVLRRIARAILCRLYRSALRFTCVVFFQNPDDLELFTSLRLLGDRNTKIINGSGVDTSWFVQRAPPDDLSFLMIARLLTDKGIREYVEACGIIKARHPSIPCRLAGWIDSNPAAIRASELSEWVNSGTIEYLGRLEDVRPALAQCGVYVLPSYREGTPRTVLEAMSTGRAVITTNAPGCKETVVSGETGLLIPVRDAKSLASAMEMFVTLEADWRAMGTAGRRLAESKYDARLVSDSIASTLGL
jgi:glycosyltransferase involved in cell wall biosynthesis